jgi:hypothetical protein
MKLKRTWGEYAAWIGIFLIAFSAPLLPRVFHPHNEPEPTPQPSKVPEQVLIETRAPCPTKPIVVQGQIVWLCENGNAYETRL